jgi:hypothetical protein
MVCIGVILVVGTYNVVASQVLHGPVNGRSLYVSVEEESGGGDLFQEDEHAECRRTARALEWTCEVPGPYPSGGSTYRVRLHPGSSCWDASGDGWNVSGDGRGLPAHISDCVHISE